MLMQDLTPRAGGLRTKGYLKKSLPDEPLVTVITVVFNGEECLEATIESVLNQTYDNIEYIVIDGGSTDGTLAIINKYNEQIDYWVSEADNGIYDAMNKAVTLARGDWCYFLGSDDVLLPEFSRLIDAVTDTGHVYYGNVVIRKTGRVSGGKFTKYKLMQQNICHQAILYPRELLVRFRYSYKYKFYADYHLNLLAFRHCRFKFVPCNVAIFDDRGASSQRDTVFLNDLPMLILHNLGVVYFLIKTIRTPIARLYKKIF